MCGIAGFSLSEADRERVNTTALSANLMLEIEYRGRDASGMAWWDKEPLEGEEKRYVRYRKNPMDARHWVKAWDGVPADHGTAIIHTRFATQGPASKNENNHPIVYGRYVGVHNGMISNDDALFRDLNADRYAQVDSEAVWALLQHSGTHPDEALTELRGSAALAWLRTDVPDTLYLCRVMGSPLSYAVTNTGSVIFASNMRDIRDALERPNNGIGPDDITYWQQMIEGEFMVTKEGKISFCKMFTPPGYKPAPAKSVYIGGVTSGTTTPPATTPTTTYNRTTFPDGSYKVTSELSGGGMVKGKWRSRPKRKYDTYYSSDGKVKKVVDVVTGTEYANYNAFKVFFEPTAHEAALSSFKIPFELMDPTFDLRIMPFAVFEGEYQDRIEEIKQTVDEVTDKDLNDYHILLRPGMWVQTFFMDKVVEAQVMALPDDYPYGDWVVRIPMYDDDDIERVLLEYVIVTRSTEEIFQYERTVENLKQSDETEFMSPAENEQDPSFEDSWDSLDTFYRDFDWGGEPVQRLDITKKEDE